MKITKILNVFMVAGLIALGFLISNQALAGTATLNWNANTESDLAGYKIYYGTSPRTGTDPKSCALCGYSTSVNAGNVLTYTFSSLTDGLTYYFSVSAYDTSNNESSFSAEVSKAIPAADTSAPTVPTSLSATAVSSSQINLSWTASTDNVGVTGYKIYRSGTQIATSATNSYSNTGLTASTAYSYTVSAYDAAGNNSAQTSPASATTQAVADTTPPVLSAGSPTGTLSSGTTSATLSVSTNENSTCKYGTMANTAYASIANTFTTTGGTTHTRTITGLTSGASYNYYVRCQDTAGNANTSDYLISFSVASALPSGDTSAPTVPTSLSATAVSSSQINLSWTASTDNVGVTGYKIYRSGTQIATSATNSYSNTGLTASTAYSYTVSAYDAAGNNSAQTSPASATTQSSSSGSTSNVSINVSLQSTSNISNKSFTINIYPANGSNSLYSTTQTVTGSALNLSSVSVSSGTYDVKISSPYYLTKKQTLTLSNNSTLSFPALLAGDLNQDNVINSLDYSMLSSKWFQQDAVADINHDGIVNSIDFSVMNANWLKAGD